jgi:pilus assembly protein Flp/PilA
MRELMRQFQGQESGATTIEYALISSLLSIMILSTIHGMSSSLVTIFTAVNTGLSH